MKKVSFSRLALLLGCVSSTTALGQYPGAYGSLAPSSFPAQQMQPLANYQPFPQVPQIPSNLWNTTQGQANGGSRPAMPNQTYASPSQGYVVQGQTVQDQLVASTSSPMAGQGDAHNVGQGYGQQTMQPGFGMQTSGMQPGITPGWLGQRAASFKLAGAQEGVHAVPAHAAPSNAIPQNMVPSPIPMQDVPQSIMECSAPMQQSMGTVEHNHNQALSYQSAPNAPMMNPVYGQSIAPGCTSCGSAPLTESYAHPSCSQGSCGPQGCLSGLGSRLGGYTRGAFFTGMPVGSKPYFGGVNILLFHRVDNDNVNLVYDTNEADGNVLGTRDARSGLMPGFELFLGRYFNCGRNAITASYWGLFPDDEMATVAAGSVLSSRYQFTGVNMPDVGGNGAAPVFDWYDAGGSYASQAQRIERSSEFHNFESNLLGFMTGGAARSFYLPTTGTMFSGTRGAHGGFGGGRRGGAGGGCGYCGGAGCGMCGSSQEGCGSGSCGSGGSCGTGSCGDCYSYPPTRYATGPCCLTPGCGSRLNMTWLAGVRYFRFDDSLNYASSIDDTVFGNGDDDIYYDSDISNNLYGFQIGGTLNYCTGRRASLYATTKMGAYGNHSKFNSDIGTHNGSLAFFDAGTTEDYVISTSKTDVAFLGELGTGVNYRLTPKWSANVGYRAIAVSGVATAVDQLPINMATKSSVMNFDNNGSLMLHGVNLGAQYNY